MDPFEILPWLLLVWICADIVLLVVLLGWVAKVLFETSEP